MNGIETPMPAKLKIESSPSYALMCSFRCKCGTKHSGIHFVRNKRFKCAVCGRTYTMAERPGQAWRGYEKSMEFEGVWEHRRRMRRKFAELHRPGYNGACLGCIHLNSSKRHRKDGK